MKKLIGLDVDNVLNNMAEELINTLNLLYNKNIDSEKIRDYSLTTIFPDLTKEQIFNPLLLKRFWNNLKVNKEGLELIKYIQEETEHDIYLVSAQVLEGFNYKLEWLKENISFVPFEKCIFTHNKSLIKLDMLVDDWEENLKDFSGRKFLLNKSYNINKDISSNIIRIDGLLDLKNYI